VVVVVVVLLELLVVVVVVGVIVVVVVVVGVAPQAVVQSAFDGAPSKSTSYVGPDTTV
jgi:hypothetical protein